MSNIEDWIRLQESKGYNDKQLEQYLIGQGYDKEQVDKLILEVKFGSSGMNSGSGNSGNVSKSGNNMLLWLGVSFLILLVIIGGIYYFVVFKNSNNLSDNSSALNGVNDTVNSSAISNESGIDQNSSAEPTLVESPPVNVSVNEIPAVNETVNATVNETPTTICGDRIRNGDEECDNTDFGIVHCWNFTSPNGNAFNGGALRCTNDCKINTSSCGYCGDGIVSIDSGERCENSIGVVAFIKNDVRYEWDVSRTSPCRNFGYASGTISCNNEHCMWNTAGCYNKINATCGNGILESGEDCDYAIIGRDNETTCSSFSHLTLCTNTTTNITTSCYQNFTIGTLSCMQDCMHDFSNCR